MPSICHLGFGFVTFGTVEEVDAAMNVRSYKVDESCGTCLKSRFLEISYPFICEKDFCCQH
jgi:hypothetical protein